MRNGAIAALLVVAILAGALAGYLAGNTNEPAINSSSGLLAQCAHAETPTPTGLLFGTVTAGTRTPAIICVQFYYFNLTTPTTLAPSMMIQAVQPNRSLSGDSNFTINTSEDTLIFGGPQDEDEGAVVAFAVTAKPGASGTYELSFSGDYMLTPIEPAECAYYGTLVAGDGHPLYVFPGGCITYNTSGTTTNSLPTIQGVPYPILTNTLFFRVVGVINSTG